MWYGGCHRLSQTINWFINSQAGREIMIFQDKQTSDCFLVLMWLDKNWIFTGGELSSLALDASSKQFNQSPDMHGHARTHATHNSQMRKQFHSLWLRLEIIKAHRSIGYVLYIRMMQPWAMWCIHCARRQNDYRAACARISDASLAKNEALFIYSKGKIFTHTHFEDSSLG